MAALTIRNLPEATHRALKVRAAAHGRSTEAEVRAILDASVRPEGRLRMGDALAELGRRAMLTDDDLDALEASRDREPVQPLDFE